MASIPVDVIWALGAQTKELGPGPSTTPLHPRRSRAILFHFECLMVTSAESNPASLGGVGRRSQPLSRCFLHLYHLGRCCCFPWGAFVPRRPPPPTHTHPFPQEASYRGGGFLHSQWSLMASASGSELRSEGMVQYPTRLQVSCIPLLQYVSPSESAGNRHSAWASGWCQGGSSRIYLRLQRLFSPKHPPAPYQAQIPSVMAPECEHQCCAGHGVPKRKQSCPALVGAPRAVGSLPRGQPSTEQCALSFDRHRT